MQNCEAAKANDKVTTGRAQQQLSAGSLRGTAMTVRRGVVLLCLLVAAAFLPTHVAAQTNVDSIGKLTCMVENHLGSGPSAPPCVAFARIEGATYHSSNPGVVPLELGRYSGNSVGPLATATGNYLGRITGGFLRTRNTLIKGTATALPGSQSGVVEVNVPSANDPGANMASQSVYFEHLEPDQATFASYFEMVPHLTLDGKLGNARSAIWASFKIHINRIGNGWFPLSETSCGIPYSGGAAAGYYTASRCLVAEGSIHVGEQVGQTYIIKNWFHGETQYGERSTEWRSPPASLELHPAGRSPWTVTVPKGYEVTIVHSASGIVEGPGKVTTNYASTSKFYLDVLTPGAVLVSKSGHDYSDPKRRRTAVTVRSETQIWPATHPNAIIASPRPRRKIVGGGAFVDWKGAGNILTGSYPWYSLNPITRNPNNIEAWEAWAKDHFAADPSRMTVFAFDLDDAQGANGKYDVAIAEVTSPPAKRPVARATLPVDYVMTGGGCRVKWEEGEDGLGGVGVTQERRFLEGAKGAGVIASPLTPTLLTPTFTESATVPAPGNLLTGSYPDETDLRSWICESKDQGEYSPAPITAYVVGIKPRNVPDAPNWPQVRIVKNTSPVTAHPAATAGKLADEFAITGCGGKAEPQSGLSRQNLKGVDPTTPTPPGQLLTAVFPIIPPGAQNVPATECQALSKDHGIAAPGTVTAYAINVLLDPPVVDSIRSLEGRRDGKPGTSVTVEGDHFFPGMELRFEGPRFAAPPVSGRFDVPFNSGPSASRGAAVVPTNLSPGEYDVYLVYRGQRIGYSTWPFGILP